MRSLVLLFLTCVACCFPRPEHIGDDGAIPDAGTSDAGTSDAALPDAAPMDFAVTLSVPKVRVAEGASATVEVIISRNAFSDAVSVTVAGLPPGVSADALTIEGDS